MLISETFAGATIKREEAREAAAQAANERDQRDKQIGARAVQDFLKKIGDPSNFTVRDIYYRENVAALLVNYPDCVTYGGDKILILENVTPLDLANLRTLDPHFLEEKHSPVVRVRPDAQGWSRAKKIVDILIAEEGS